MLNKGLFFVAFLAATLSSALADVIKNYRYFSAVGQIAEFSWAPERYNNNFRYDIFYYIPPQLASATNVPALIFNHGGGASTMDRAGSRRAVGLYIQDLKRLADELGFIAVLPSANGLNWGGHTRGLMRDLARLMRSDLDVDSHRIGWSGHSMGGMGITRTYLMVADEFAFVLPMAAGMDVNHQTEEHLNKQFNIPYVHLQGMGDHFDIFIERCQEQLKRTQDLERLYGVNSKLDMVFYQGSHNYDYNLFKGKLAGLFANSPRDLYQPKLWGSVVTQDTNHTDNNITFNMDSVPRYFWVELKDTDLTTPEHTNFRAEVVGQRIDINFATMPVQSKTVRVYLHSEMLNLRAPVEIFINGQKRATRLPSAGVLRSMDSTDAGYLFEDFVDIAL